MSAGNWSSNMPGSGRLTTAVTEPITPPNEPPPLPNGVVKIDGPPLSGQAPVWNGNEWVPEDTLAYTGTPDAPNQVPVWSGTNPGVWSPQTLLSGMIQGDWETYTPTLTPETGAITAYTATGRYLAINNAAAIFQVTALLTNIGTAAGYAVFSLPAFTPTGTSTALAIEEAVTSANYATCNCKSGIGIGVDQTNLAGGTIWVNNYKWAITILLAGTFP